MRTKFTFQQERVPSDQQDSYERRYTVTHEGQPLGWVALCHSGDWTYEGIDLMTEITTSTRQYAAERLLAHKTKETG